MKVRLSDNVTPLDVSKAESPSTKMLLALAATGKHIYEGTVSPAVVAVRRHRNKAARAARRINRKAGA